MAAAGGKIGGGGAAATTFVAPPAPTSELWSCAANAEASATLTGCIRARVRACMCGVSERVSKRRKKERD